MSILATADFVIIGAGSAGCALAYRLSESGQYTVLILEYGGSDMGPLIQMPAALSYPMNMRRYDWGYQTEPEPHLNHRQLVCPRGKVIGGSSSINGMVYVRGNALDYEHWQKSGAKGWGYADVLPYFKRMENTTGNASWRGHSGPLYVRKGAQKNPLYHAFVVAGKQAGYPLTDDYNAEQQEGFGAMEMTVHNGKRWSAANGYLKPALKRKNCTLIHCHAQRIIFDNKQAVAVEVKHKGQLKTITANKEVILSASAINSPKILKCSGIGPAAELKQHNIKVIADRAGIGENLQDHLEVYLQNACLQPITLYKYMNWFAKGAIGLRWLLFKTGIGATNHFESAAFIRSKAGVSYPDIQFHFMPVAIRYDGTAPAEGHGFQAHVGPMRSASRGQVLLNSQAPEAAPKIMFNYLSQPQDLADFRLCVKLTRELFAQPVFDPFRGKEILPGQAVESDEEIDEFIRAEVESAFHPCGTCKMGDEKDPMAVVDAQGRVIGVNKLRVIDSSIFPRIPNGNLNGPSIMVAEKMSDHILDKVLPKDEVIPWQHPHWQTQQR